MVRQPVGLIGAAITAVMGAKAQFLRDMRKRLSAQDMEVQRRAFLFVARNATLPAQVRHKAQLGLNALNGGEGRMGAVKNRCVETGRGRGMFTQRESSVWLNFKAS
jgi:small subunit ribosomal protein S14